MYCVSVCLSVCMYSILYYMYACTVCLYDFCSSLLSVYIAVTSWYITNLQVFSYLLAICFPSCYHAISYSWHSSADKSPPKQKAFEVRRYQYILYMCMIHINLSGTTIVIWFYGLMLFQWKIMKFHGCHFLLCCYDHHEQTMPLHYKHLQQIM